MNLDRLGLLEQRVTVMQQEINEVLGEAQNTITLLIQGNARAFASLQAQIDELKKQQSGLPMKSNPDTGVEL